MNNFRKALCFDDVLLVDDHSHVSSRAYVDLEIEVQKGSATFKFVPIMNAAMDTVANIDTGKALVSNGCAFVHHRYNTLQDRVEDIAEVGEWLSGSGHDPNRGILGISVGMNENLSHITNIIDYVDLISIDVAAANNSYVVERIKDLGKICEKYDTLLMVGNYSCPTFLSLLENKKAYKYVDILKVSQGGGSCCSTRIKTGVGVPTFQAVKDSYEMVEGLYELTDHRPIVCADGGIRTSGDMMKAFGVGAGACMVGGMLGGHDESAGDLITVNGRNFKQVRGMASSEAKSDALGHTDYVEGVSRLVKSKGPIQNTIDAIFHGLQSGLSLCGCERLEDFIGQGKFVIVSPSSVGESVPHLEGI